MLPTFVVKLPKRGHRLHFSTILLDVLVSSYYLKFLPWYVYEMSKERTSELGIVGF